MSTYVQVEETMNKIHQNYFNNIDALMGYSRIDIIRFFKPAFDVELNTEEKLILQSRAQSFNYKIEFMYDQGVAISVRVYKNNEIRGERDYPTQII